MGQHFSFTCGVNGIDHTTLLESVVISENQWFNCVFWNDPTNGEKRPCLLHPDQFLRRFLQHALPAGTHQIRYFGWLHPAAKQRRLMVEETLLAVRIVVRAKPVASPEWRRLCPHCWQFTLIVIGKLSRAPP